MPMERVGGHECTKFAQPRGRSLGQYSAAFSKVHLIDRYLSGARHLASVLTGEK